MSGEIEVALKGHLAADAVVKVAGGSEVAELRVACGIRRKDGAGVWSDVRTDWVTVTVWKEWLVGRAAQLVKGQAVRVEGRLRVSAYINKDGEAVPSIEVSASDITVGIKNPQPAAAAGKRAA